MAAALYRDYMKLCGVWHADPTRKGKCLGEFIRKRVSEEFRQSERTVVRDPANCARRLKSLQALSSNSHSNRYPRLSESSASGLTRAECSQLIYDNLHAVGKVEQESTLLNNLRERFSFKIGDATPENPRKMKSSYVCIHCGEAQQQLYKRYGPDLLKLSRCSKCNHTVDEYIEMELSIVFIDAVLQKLEAYRHLIFNLGVERPWKLALFFLLGEALELWMSRRQDAGANLGLEWHFYLTCLFLVASNAVFLALVVALTNLRVKTCDREQLAWALVLGSYGKLLALPATLWGCDRFQAHLLVTAFFLCSQVQACRVVSGAGRTWAVVVVAASYLLQQGAVALASPLL